MFFRFLLLAATTIAGSISAQDLENFHPISDVYVVKYQNDPDNTFWVDYTELGDRPSSTDIKAWIDEGEKYYQSAHDEHSAAYKVISNYNGRFYSLYTSDPDIETKTFLDNESWREDAVLVSSQHNRDNNLFACSSFSRADYRLYAFRKNSPEIFLWEDKNLPQGRTYFHSELEAFNSNGRYFLTQDGRKWDAWGLPRGQNFRVRDIDNCYYQGAWVAILNSSSNYQGDAYTFQSRDLAVLWAQVLKYKEQGIYLVDIEKGEIEGRPLWYGVFSSSKFIGENISFRIYKNHDEFTPDISNMRDQGFSVVDMVIASRGSI